MPPALPAYEVGCVILCLKNFLKCVADNTMPYGPLLAWPPHA